MDNLFLSKLILSFFIGASWVIFATTVADKLGSKVGGLITGLPSTVMFGLFFLAWTQSTQTAVLSTMIIPIVGGINCLFLVIYIYLVRKNIWIALASAFAVWASLSYLLVRIHFNNYLVSLTGYIVLLVASYLLVEKVFKIKSTKGAKISYTPALIVTRGLIGGFVVALAVYLGKIGGPILGGMFSMFPAMFTSTILVTYFSHGSQFSAATMKSSMVSGMSIVVYSIVARYAYPPFGLVWGTLFSIIVSFGWGYMSYKLIITKLS